MSTSFVPFVPHDHNLEEEHEEVRFVPNPVGPSSQGCCKNTVSNVCGSGSLVGVRNGKSLILTNAHVAGTTIGRQVNCQFPFLQNRVFTGRILMAAYSRNAIGMDWAILEADQLIPLPHTKLDNRLPSVTVPHYTAGYPKCSGPRFQNIELKNYMNNGTIARWQPNAIGGQSGSAVHRKDNDLQSILLTWSIGSDGAGQTAYGIWLQYVNRAAIGYQQPEGLVELAWENKRLPDSELVEGFHYETNITTLDIWAHLDPPTDPGPGPIPGPGPVPDCKDFANKVLAHAESLNREADALLELARSYGANPENNSGGGGPTFGL
jgi:hypothetical protein